MIEPGQLAAIVLAGGKSLRMGTDKGLMKFNGKKMIEHVLDVLKEITEQVMIVSNHADYKQFGYPVISDAYPNSGPLGGMHAGLRNSGHKWNFILSCDIPFMTPDFLKFLISVVEADERPIIPVHGQTLQPLCGLYPASVARIIESFILNKQLKVQDAVKQMNARIIEVPEDRFDPTILFRNFNSPEDPYNF